MDIKCPVEDKLYWDGVMKSPEVLAIVDQHKTLYEFLRSKTGLPLPTLDQIWEVQDPLNCEVRHIHIHNNFPQIKELVIV